MIANITGSISLPDLPYQMPPPRYISAREAFYATAIAGLLPRVDAYLLTDDELVAKAWAIAEAALKHAQVKGHML